MKSNRKVLNRKNFESEKPLSEVQNIIDAYNDGKYYNAVEVSTVDGRSENFQNFDTSYYLTSKAISATYQSIPGY
jgi:hypothetical protein